MNPKIIGLLTGTIAGYLIGMVLGFTLFDPDLDVWALLGCVLALAGLGIGLTPFFQRYVVVILLALVGFYIGSLVGIVLVGNTASDDLLEILQSQSILFAVGGTVIGGAIGAWLPVEKARWPLFALIIGGFLGGYILGVVFGLAPYPSLVGWSPFVMGSGLATVLIAAMINHRKQKN